MSDDDSDKSNPHHWPVEAHQRANAITRARLLSDRLRQASEDLRKVAAGEPVAWGPYPKEARSPDGLVALIESMWTRYYQVSAEKLPYLAICEALASVEEDFITASSTELEDVTLIFRGVLGNYDPSLSLALSDQAIQKAVEALRVPDPYEKTRRGRFVQAKREVFQSVVEELVAAAGVRQKNGKPYTGRTITEEHRRWTDRRGLKR